jgi:hypothetical protein
MATAILNHRVKDYASWKTGFDGDSARRSAAGVTELAVGQRSDDPGMVYIVFHVQDASVITGMMNDPELQQIMQENGVISKPEMMIIE